MFPRLIYSLLTFRTVCRVNPFFPSLKDLRDLRSKDKRSKDSQERIYSKVETKGQHGKLSSTESLVFRKKVNQDEFTSCMTGALLLLSELPKPLGTSSRSATRVGTFKPTLDLFGTLQRTNNPTRDFFPPRR